MSAHEMPPAPWANKIVGIVDWEALQTAFCGMFESQKRLALRQQPRHGQPIVEVSMAILLEVWAPIPGWDGIYAVSTLGRIIRVAGNIPGATAGRILKPQNTPDGYLAVTLTRHNKPQTVRVHRAVALAFLEPPTTGLQVNHKDGVKTNNRLDNLEWVDGKATMAHADQNGLWKHKGMESSQRKLNEEQVREIRRLHALGTLGYKRLAARYGLDHTTISQIDRRVTWRDLDD